MERHYAVLHRKLAELEALLQELPSSPPPHHHHDHPMVVEDEEFIYRLDHEEIQARLGFLKTLLATELEINAESTPEQLQGIADRLATLEEAYNKLIDARSSCSCTSSCFNEEEKRELDAPVVGEDDIAEKQELDAEEVGEVNAEEEQEKIDGELTAEEDDDEEDEVDAESLEQQNYDVPVAPFKDVQGFCSHVNKEHKRVKEKKQQQQQFSGRKCGFLGIVVLLAAATAMVVTNFWPVEEEFLYLVPT